ncbi:hypothetical protein [Streptomyces benahoarensis]|uniref:Uncharacterized protein n=1 Tax=Streptomyces benahoarensis TaxID=2595054 RepID=A0A553Z6B5_9ACTN|nr:hypothetical protein [Streptomyces benahoarensis]TSB25122.1 hypothetical protein FNJ62_13385 [Streptomyces benahoarensis]TSB36972.1 hypothetical protein FNZ23_19205 [Streptomyces benahoarensis]
MNIMRRVKQDTTPTRVGTTDGDSSGFVEDGDPDEFGTYDIFRVSCPDCGQPIALLAEEDSLPEHALCPSPWNPFGLTVCQGSGRPVSDAVETPGALDAHEQDAAVLLTLPESLDWRRQPFSHIGGDGSRAPRLPRMRRA